MSRILLINSVCTGSTGKICKDIYDLAIEFGHDCCLAFGRGEIPSGYNVIKIGTKFDVLLHVLKTRLFDRHGFGSKRATRKFIKQIEEYNPDIIHLHNLHGYYLNIEMLFKYLKNNPQIKVIWTLHDCWAFTGHCSYFTMSKCQNWKNGCYVCKNKHDYPSSLFFSKSDLNYKEKEEIFTQLDSMQLVTPSKWLKNLIEQSFLSKFDCCVINNGINTEKFYKKKSNYNSKKKIILGVANIWDERKGLKYFIELNEKIDKNIYQIVLVGLSKKQINNLPSNIIGLQKTTSLRELVDIYQKADIMFNPTLEDNYPTVNIEAQACGTPVIAFDNGGTKETLFSTSKLVNNVDEFISKLEHLDKFKNDFQLDSSKLDSKNLFKQYIKIYEEVL